MSWLAATRGFQFAGGNSRDLDGSEHVAIRGLDANEELTVVPERDAGSTVEFPDTVQVATPVAVRYGDNDGVLQLVFRHLLTGE